MTHDALGLEGQYLEQDLPLLIQRRGMAVWSNNKVVILDRRKLPLEESFVECTTPDSVATAIEDMVIQGAFSIGITAGFGFALTEPQTLDSYRETAIRLQATRPTGLALKRMLMACLEAAEKALAVGDSPRAKVLELVEGAAATLARQGWRSGARAADLIPDDATILTHCFPDRAYAYMLVELNKRQKNIRVVCSETRPYLQGARLTALCAQQLGFETQVITDGMGGFLMRQKEIDAFVTAADRVCMDGSVCNKIGTYQYALAAYSNGIPYYALRQSGPDVESANESDVQIEYRDGEEILNWRNQRLAPEGVAGLYPAFDVTPPNLVHSIVTDRGVFAPDRIHSYSDTPPFVENAIV